MKILFIGDIVGKPGRQAVMHLLPDLAEEISPDLIIANAENAAGGKGITQETAEELFRAGVNVLTLGNHVWSRGISFNYLDAETRIVRPANYPDGVPGRGWTVIELRSFCKIGIVNLCGRVFMEQMDNPFARIDSILETLSHETDVILVDFHGEATSEKSAFAWYVDGRVGAVIGTHTHVQTADERVLPGGTAFITDVGMTGPINSVIGRNKESVISRFLTQMPSKFVVADGPALFSGVIVDLNPSSGKAESIKRLQSMWNGISE